MKVNRLKNNSTNEEEPETRHVSEVERERDGARPEEEEEGREAESELAQAFERLAHAGYGRLIYWHNISHQIRGLGYRKIAAWARIKGSECVGMTVKLLNYMAMQGIPCGECDIAAIKMYDSETKGEGLVSAFEMLLEGEQEYTSQISDLQSVAEKGNDKKVYAFLTNLLNEQAGREALIRGHLTDLKLIEENGGEGMFVFASSF